MAFIAARVYLLNPPIVVGDISRPQAMTVEWAREDGYWTGEHSLDVLLGQGLRIAGGRSPRVVEAHADEGGCRGRDEGSQGDIHGFHHTYSLGYA